MFLSNNFETIPCILSLGLFYICVVVILLSNRRSAIHRGRVWFSQLQFISPSKRPSTPIHKQLCGDFKIPPHQSKKDLVLFLKCDTLSYLKHQPNVCQLVKITLSSPVCWLKSTGRLRMCPHFPQNLSFFPPGQKSSSKSFSTASSPSESSSP